MVWCKEKSRRRHQWSSYKIKSEMDLEIKTVSSWLYGDFQPGLKFQLGIPSWNFISAKQYTPLWNYIVIVFKNCNSAYRVEISTRFSKPEMKFQPGMKISNFPFNRHFFQPGMKIWYYARTNFLFIFKVDKLINLMKCLKV